MKLADRIVVLDELRANSKGNKPEFILKDDKIDVDKLDAICKALVDEARRTNDGVKSAGRRFRNATIDLEKNFLSLRGISTKQ